MRRRRKRKRRERSVEVSIPRSMSVVVVTTCRCGHEPVRIDVVEFVEESWVGRDPGGYQERLSWTENLIIDRRERAH